jgi:hypothetical protein
MSRLRLWLAAFALSVMAPSLALAASMLEGTWTGGGYVQPANGERERVTCKVVYRQISDKLHSVTATCATASMKIVQTGELTTVREDRYIGDFANIDYKVFGRVRVVVKGNSQNVTFSSEVGTGTLALKRR